MSSTPPILSSSDAQAVTRTRKTYDLSEEEWSLLQESAAEAKSTAYCPYSKFRVGAAVLVSPRGERGERSEASKEEKKGEDDIRVVTGGNVENASYPVGTCAERVALARALAEGHHVRGFKAIAVSTDISPPASPCGMCRQFIREFLPLDAPVIMFDKNADYVVMRLKEVNFPLVLNM
ncbi:cytidine deaminase [Geosmithia morbida]|uniref:Cytidine deaminase n=1 Tax=Geosmithia morbida TaxID=1094350 RepID=A0A9P4YYM6_9HYPO|nr:cytidine deaminase [Geosmithia morbida]KAF4124078.1 cytidine deaminase [Geosmithia morbida]